MELIQWQTVLAILSTLSAMLIAWLGWGRNRHRDASENGAAMATMQASIATSNARLEEVLRKLDRMQENYNGITVQIAGLESRCESMHKQHDELVARVQMLEKQVRGQ